MYAMKVVRTKSQRNIKVRGKHIQLYAGLKKRLAQLPKSEELIYQAVALFAARKRALPSFFCFAFLYTFLRLVSTDSPDAIPIVTEQNRNAAKWGYHARIAGKKENQESYKKQSPLASISPYVSTPNKSNLPSLLTRLKKKIQQTEDRLEREELSSQIQRKARLRPRTESEQSRFTKAKNRVEELVYVAFTGEDGRTFSKHISLLKAIGKQNKESIQLYKKKAREALARKKHDLALRYLDEARSYDPNDIEIDYLEAEAYLGKKGKKNWKRAKKLLQSYLHSQPEHALAHFRLGQIYYGENLYISAAEHYSSAIKIQPGMHIARLNLAINLIKQKEYEKARLHLNKILKAKPKMWKAAYYLAEIHAKKDEYAQALSILNKYLASNPQKALLHQGKGEILYKMRDFKQAALSLQHALRQRSSYANWLLLSGALHAQKLYRPSLNALLNAKKIYSMDPNLHYRLGKLYLKLNQKDTALKSFEESLSISPAHKEALLNSLDLYNALALVPRAFAKIEETLQHLEEKTENYDFHIQVADFYTQHKKYEKAQSIYRSAIEANPQNPKAYLKMVTVSRRLRAYRQAELSYQELLHNIPDYAEGHRLLGLLYHSDMKMPSKAKQHLEKYLSLRPDSSDTNKIHSILRKL